MQTCNLALAVLTCLFHELHAGSIRLEGLAAAARVLVGEVALRERRAPHQSGRATLRYHHAVHAHEELFAVWMRVVCSRLTALMGKKIEDFIYWRKTVFISALHQLQKLIWNIVEIRRKIPMLVIKIVTRY